MGAKMLLAALLLACVWSQTTGNASSIAYQPNVVPCVAFQNAKCTTCAYNYHINQNQCYRNITACLNYTLNAVGNEECSQCNSGAVLDGSGGCSLLNNRTNVFTQNCEAQPTRKRHSRRLPTTGATSSWWCRWLRPSRTTTS
jgi:hypothetical protein